MPSTGNYLGISAESIDFTIGVSLNIILVTRVGSEAMEAARQTFDRW